MRHVCALRSVCTVLYCCLALCALAAGQCEVPFAVNQQLSSLNLTGGTREPVTGSLVRTGANADTPISLKGGLIAIVPGSCQELDAASLPQHLAGARFEVDPAGPLALQPRSIKANVGGYVDLDFIGVLLELNSTDFAASSGLGNGKYDSTLEAAISGGYVEAKAVIYESPFNVSLGGLVASSACQVVGEKASGGNLARVTLQAFKLTFVSTFVNEYQGSPLVGVSEYIFQGSIVLDAAMGSGGQGAGAAAPPSPDASDEDLLLAFQASFSNGAERLQWGANPGGPCSSWYGVACNAQGQVTDINLRFAGLVGSISPTGWPLPASLEKLSFSGCKLQGSIPEGFSLPAGLRELDLTTNLLTGTLPSGWALPSGLQQLALQFNSLKGTLPSYNLANCSIYMQPGNDGICGTVPDKPLYRFNSFTSPPRPLPPLPDCPQQAASPPGSNDGSAPPAAIQPSNVSSVSSSSSSSSNVGVIAGVVSGVAATAVLALLGYWYFLRRRKAGQSKGGKPSGDLPSCKLSERDPDENTGLDGGMPGADGAPPSAGSNTDPFLLSIRSMLAGLSRGSSKASGSEGAPSLVPGGQADSLMATPASGISSQSSRGRMLSPDIRLWIIPFLDLDMRQQIGVGSFGKVYLAVWQETQVAVKVLLDACSTSDANAAANMALSLSNPVLASLKEEASTMAALRHPNVLGFIGLCTVPPCVISEYCPRGSLFDVLREARTSLQSGVNNTVLNWHRVVDMALDTAKGCLYLHSRNLVHRDLRSPNLLISRAWQIKVSDFNLSKLVQPNEASGGKSSTAVTNPRWLAPEVLAGDSHTFASDIFSFGVVLWELLSWERPWENISNPWQVAKYVMGGHRLPTPDASQLARRFGEQDGLPAFVDLMQRCQAQDPRERPNFNQIIAELRQLEGGEGAGDISDRGGSTASPEASIPREALAGSMSGPTTPGVPTDSSNHMSSLRSFLGSYLS